MVSRLGSYRPSIALGFVGGLIFDLSILGFLPGKPGSDAVTSVALLAPFALSSAVSRLRPERLRDAFASCGVGLLAGISIPAFLFGLFIALG
jgi:hypothetical protein